MKLTNQQLNNFKKNTNSPLEQKTKWVLVNQEGEIRKEFHNKSTAKNWKGKLETTFIEKLELKKIEDVVTL